jgi:hypothetical protein
MPFGVVAKRLDGQHRIEDAFRQIYSGAQKDSQAVSRTFTQLGEQFAVVEEKLAQNDRNAENILPVRQRIEDIFPQQFTELDYLLCMAGRTEPAAPSRKS